MLASDWVESKAPNTQQLSWDKRLLSHFDFVFFIELRYVNDSSTLEQLIIKQHGLTGKNISESQVRSVLEGEKVLLLLDGYDEYTKGTNKGIAAAIEDTVGDCFLLLTSRDGDYISKETQAKFDGEIKITGFDYSDIQEFAKKYFENGNMAGKLIVAARESGLYDMLSKPIILLMVCVLFQSTQKLPKSQTEVVANIMEMYMDRSSIKHFGRKTKDIAGLENLLYRLGELSWASLKRNRKQLLLQKVSSKFHGSSNRKRMSTIQINTKDEKFLILQSAVQEISEDLLRLGLLQAVPSGEEASLHEQPELMTFAHKLFHEYWAAYFISRRLTNRNTKVINDALSTLCFLFTSLKNLKNDPPWNQQPWNQQPMSMFIGVKQI